MSVITGSPSKVILSSNYDLTSSNNLCFSASLMVSLSLGLNFSDFSRKSSTYVGMKSNILVKGLLSILPNDFI